MNPFSALRRVFDGASGTGKGMALMLFSTLGFVCMQSLIRHVGQDVHPFEVAFFRNIFGLLALAPIFFQMGLAPLKTKRFKLHAMRGGMQSFGMLSFFYGVTLIPFAEVTALSFSGPLFATVIALIFLGERLRIRRMTALVLGFVGMVIVVRPGFEEINLGTWLIVSSSMTWGVSIALIKLLSRTESSATMVTYQGLFLLPFTFAAAMMVWTWPTAEQLLLMALIGCLGTASHLAFAQSFKYADSTAILPLDFTRLIWASIIGYLAWNEIPDAFAWAGGAIIFGSATYIAFREAKLARMAKREQAAAVSEKTS
jgi:drug/metabolite transporter (DMT)-like permease